MMKVQVYAVSMSQDRAATAPFRIKLTGTTTGSGYNTFMENVETGERSFVAYFSDYRRAARNFGDRCRWHGVSIVRGARYEEEVT